MTYELVIEPEAQEEIDDAISWYESRQKGLGLVFLKYLEGYFEILKSDKISFAIKRKPCFGELGLKHSPLSLSVRSTKILSLYILFFIHIEILEKNRNNEADLKRGGQDST